MLNVTLGLQAGHFLIVYWFLSRYFFKPILQQLELEDQEQARLVILINKSRELLREGLVSQEEHWSILRRQFGQQMAFCANLKMRPMVRDANILDLPGAINPGDDQIGQVADRLIQKINGRE